MTFVRSFAQKILLEITINTLSECSQIGSLIMSEETGDSKEPDDIWDESSVQKKEIFSLIESLMNRLLYNLSSQEVSGLLRT